MYERRNTETLIEVDMSKLIDGPVDYLKNGLKNYSDTQLNEIENYAKSNIRTVSSGVYEKGKGWGFSKEQQYLIKMGLHSYIPSTVIEAIAEERKSR